jgi:hypothetical protein
MAGSVFKRLSARSFIRLIAAGGLIHVAISRAACV